MVANANPHNLPGGDELIGHQPVVKRRVGVAAGMVMDQDQRRRSLGNRLTKDLTRVDQR